MIFKFGFDSYEFYSRVKGRFDPLHTGLSDNLVDCYGAGVSLNEPLWISVIVVAFVAMTSG